MNKFLSAFLLLSLTATTAFSLSTGDAAPPFTLPSADGRQVSLKDFAGKIVVLEWFNPGCPFVKKHYNSGHMQSMQMDAAAKDIVWLTVNSTNSEHRDYASPEKSKAVVEEHGMKSAAYLIDADGTVGKAYGAKTTPHVFIVDKAGTLVYRGAIDDQANTNGDPSKATNYVSNALEELRSGKKITTSETKEYGCSVKY